MKKILLALVVFYSASSFGIQQGDLNINGGFGVFGSRGLIGFSADKFLTPNHALSFAVGLDLVGATSAIGYKYFGDKINNSNTIRDKCFLLIECDSHLYVGPSLQYAGGTTVKIIEDAGEREYKVDPKWLGLLGIGIRNVFKNNVTFDAEISYRGIITGGKAAQTVGPPVDDTKTVERGFRTVGINVGIGYLF